MNYRTHSITGDQGHAYTGEVAAFYDSNTGLPTTDYTAIIDWGDGNESQGTVDSDGSGGFIVMGTDTFAASGSLSVTVTITDMAGS